MSCRSLIIFAALLSSSIAVAQGDDLSITIPQLPAGKTFNFSYDAVVADPYASLDAATVAQQAFVDAEEGFSTSSLLVDIRLDNPPALDLNGAGNSGAAYSTSFVQADGPVALAAPDAVIGERAAPEIQSLVVALSQVPDGVNESLDADVTGTPAISKSYNSLTGVLTLSGTGTVANYEQVLRSVTYNNTATTVDTSQRVAVFVASDDFSESTPVAATFTVLGDSAVIDWSTY